jgi:hypothetical protein
MSDDLVTWLRRQVEDDLSIARIISQGGFEPQRWDTEPPGQVNPPKDPASTAISEAIGQEPEYSCGWVQIVVYEREIGDPPEEEYREPGSVAALADIGRRQFDHIIRHDPRSVVADCEAKLAILDAHDKAEHYCPIPVLPSVHGQRWTPEEGPCWTVLLLADGYRHRPGYREEWKP